MFLSKPQTQQTSFGLSSISNEQKVQLSLPSSHVMRYMQYCQYQRVRGRHAVILWRHTDPEEYSVLQDPTHKD